MGNRLADLIAKQEARYGDAALGYPPPVGPAEIRFSGKLSLSAKQMEAGRYGTQKLKERLIRERGDTER